MHLYCCHRHQATALLAFFIALLTASDAFISLHCLLFLTSRHGAEKLLALSVLNLQKYKPAADEAVPKALQQEISLAASEIWNAVGSLPDFLIHENNDRVTEGEATLKDGILYSDRALYFHEEAIRGCPQAQHSYALLLWSGFGGVVKDSEASARWHAAAAAQNHLDGMAVFGGCLRTGKGVKRNASLGLKIIEYCAAKGNPTGINKKAALLESNHDEAGAVKLYESCYQSGTVNALLLMNLGWCLVNGIGVNKKNVERGVKLWQEAASMAPDEGSEEAAWYLYEEYKYKDPKEARK
jgi:TPR repeat protein